MDWHAALDAVSKSISPTFQRLWAVMDPSEPASARELCRRSGLRGGPVRYILWRFAQAGWAVERPEGWIKIEKDDERLSS